LYKAAVVGTNGVNNDNNNAAGHPCCGDSFKRVLSFLIRIDPFSKLIQNFYAKNYDLMPKSGFITPK
jgi:hypothetical protein